MKPYIFNEYSAPVVIAPHTLLMINKDLYHLVLFEYKKNIIINTFKVKHKTNTKLFFSNGIIIYGIRDEKKSYKSIIQNLNFKKEKFSIEDTVPIEIRNDFILGHHIVSNIIYNRLVYIPNKKEILSLKNDEYSLYLFNDKNLYYLNKNSLLKFENSTGEKVWETDLTDLLGEIKYNTFSRFNWDVNDHVLWSQLDDGRLMLFDDNNGAFLEFVSNPYPDGKYGYYLMDKINGKMIKLRNDTYYEIDLKTKEISYFEIPEIKLKNFTPNGLFVQNDTHVFFNTERGDKIYSLDKKTKSLELIYEINQEGVGKDDWPRQMTHMNYDKGKLIVADNKGTTYIFDEL